VIAASPDGCLLHGTIVLIDELAGQIQCELAALAEGLRRRVVTVPYAE
jgi:hypothetical protein